jgi:flagellar biosynthesis/type III secretory pathway chaperone
MAFYLSLSYEAMKNVLQELDAIVKDEFASLPFAISPQKVESLVKKPMINQQVSLASQVLKNPKADNAQHVLEIVELDDFDTEKTKVVKRQPLKRLKKTLLSLEACKKKNKQGIETHEEDNQISPKKTVVDLLDQRTIKKSSGK